MDQKIKQRLIGAIVLVALAVIFVPIILEGPDNEWTPRSHSIPKQPGMDYRASMDLEIPQQAEDSGAGTDGVINKALDLPKPAMVADQGKALIAVPPEVAKPAIQPPVAESTPVAPVKSTKPAKQAKPVKPPARAKNKKQPVIKGWFVQVGSFGEKMNAAGLRDRLKKAGYVTKLHKVGIGSGYAYRVLVGPSSSRTEADQNAARLKSGLQLSGMVIEYP